MKNAKTEYRNFIWYTFVPLSIFILFKEGIDHLLSYFIVQPILSYCSSPNWLYDTIILITFALIVATYINKINRKVKIPEKWYYITVTYITIFLTYRVSAFFDFTSFRFTSYFKLLDLLSSIPVILCLVSLFNKKPKPIINIESSQGFIVDEATLIVTGNDLLNRGKFVKTIALMIKNTNSINGSFPIGIVAAWGSGKTTFLNTLKKEIANNDFITIELNLWKCNSSNQIIEILFKLLQENLNKYSFTISNKVQYYTSLLLKGAKGDGVNSIKTLSDLIFSDQSIEKQYDSINLEIKNINKKILILIDDLDRLDKKEIYEVIRLIRNTANFSNTFFVVAYDRNYILNAIEDINAYRSHLFLEKIFQVEFTLPPIDHKLLQNEITKNIKKFISEKSKEGYMQILEPGIAFFDERIANLTSYHISNIRDVVRFINSFKLSYEFVKDEVYFPDFYNLELIRFKHPEIFAEIYRNSSNFLTTETGETRLPTAGSTYSLKIIKDGNNTPTNNSVLAKYLKDEQAVYKLTEKDISTIVVSYAGLFPQLNSMSINRTVKANSHLSVIRPSMFNRYFILGIEGKLSEIKFSKMRELPSTQFNDEITKLCQNMEILVDISERFEEIKEFDTREDFEKVIHAIFHFANLPHPNKEENSRFEQIQYNGEALAEVLGNERNLRFYDTDKEEYKKFLFSILQTNSVKYTYTNDFVSFLLHKGIYYIEKIISDEEISKILFENFKNAIDQSNIFTIHLWWHFIRCETRKQTDAGNNTYQIKYPIQKKAKQLMRKLIFDKDLDNFILFSIRQTPFGKRFILEGTLVYVFKSNEIFIWLLKRYKGISKYKDEFLIFYEALVTKEEYKQEGVPLEFFKVIPADTKVIES